MLAADDYLVGRVQWWRPRRFEQLGGRVRTSIAKFTKGLACLAAAAALAACSTAPVDSGLATGSVKANGDLAATSPAPAAGGAIVKGNPRIAKVALLLPLSGTGETAIIAKSLKQAGEMALFDGSSSTLQLVVKDDRGTPEGAAAAAEEAIKDGAEMIIGPLFATSVRAVSPVAQRANIPVVAFSNDMQVAGRGVYLMSFLVTQDIERIVGYAASKGRKRFAALLPDDAYGRVMGDAFRAAVAANGGSVKALETYQSQGNAALEPIRRVVEGIKRADEDGEPVEAVFLPGGPDTLASLAPMLTYAGLDSARVKLIGTGGWDYSGIGREAALVGGWFPAPEPRGWQEFSERFGRTFGSAPPRIASLSYDAVMMAMQLSGNPPGGRFTAANLTRTAGFTGADGAVRLRADGLADRGLAVLEVQKMGTNVLEPASAPVGPGRMSATTATQVN